MCCEPPQIAVENSKGQGVPGGKPRPSVMAFSRQGMPNQPGTSIEGVAKGGYVVHGGDKKPDVILISTGTHKTCLHQSFCNSEGEQCRTVERPRWAGRVALATLRWEARGGDVGDRLVVVGRIALRGERGVPSMASKLLSSKFGVYAR